MSLARCIGIGQNCRMMKFRRVWVLGLAVHGLAIFGSAQADVKERLARSYWQKRLEHRQGKQVLELERGGGASESSVRIATLEQPIDHFARPDSASAGYTFKQRYFIDSTYADGENSPVLFYICGESTCEGPSSVPLLNRMARKLRAHRVALEHRYYGESHPFPTLTADHLRFLSMDQAIEDLAFFQRFATAVLKLNGRWISVGGSYPGELSAFYRMKHPELVVGALASSAPVYAKSDFFEYDRHVARIADPACLRVIQKVVAEVESRLIQEPSRAEVKRLFQSESVPHDVDFLYVLADMAAIAIQYGFEKPFCSALIDGDQKGDPVAAYAKTGLSMMATLGTSPFQDSFGGAMSENPADYQSFAGRQWMYQSCTEFGFYQIANPGGVETSRSSRIDLAYHHEACARLFGLKKPVNTDQTNRRYYAKLLEKNTDRIYFTNGSNDPWSNLSFTDESWLKEKNPGLDLFLIPGASHCDDLGSRMFSALNEARTRFESLVSGWLSE